MTRDLGPDRLLLTPSLRVVAENAAPSVEPLILSNRSAEEPQAAEAEPEAEDRLHLVEAEWEDELWAAPEAPLAELALGAEEAEVVAIEAVADTAWPEADEGLVDWSERPAPEWVEDAPILPEAGAEVARPGEPAAVADATEAAFVAPGLAMDAALSAEVPAPASVTEGAAMAADDEDDIDVAEVLAAAVAEDESFHFMNEAELHDLVRTLVRQELQGSLGERITRNVRKLVRAEVNRALAAQALD
jgi:hypothetical protein